VRSTGRQPPAAIEWRPTLAGDAVLLCQLATVNNFCASPRPAESPLRQGLGCRSDSRMVALDSPIGPSHWAFGSELAALLFAQFAADRLTSPSVGLAPGKRVAPALAKSHSTYFTLGNSRWKGMEMRLTPVCHVIDIASPGEEESLRLSAGARVIRLDRLRYDGGTFRTFERSVLALHRVSGIPVDRVLHLTLPEIAKVFGLELGKATERLCIAPAPPAVARHLAVSPTQDLLQINRVTTTVDEAPIEWCVVYAMEMAS